MEFLYKAYADSGEVKEGRVAAAGKREAANELRSRGLHPMTIRKTGDKKKVSLFKRRRLADLAEEWESLKKEVRERMLAAGAHFVLDTIAELPACIEKINNRN